jgi:hypothetical protein
MWFKTKQDNVQTQVVAQVLAAPIVVNPTDEEGLKFAEYRADAIARDIEQRKNEERELHPEHDQMVAEAMMYGHMLVQAKKWTLEHIEALKDRVR